MTHSTPYGSKKSWEKEGWKNVVFIHQIWRMFDVCFISDLLFSRQCCFEFTLLEIVYYLNFPVFHFIALFCPLCWMWKMLMRKKNNWILQNRTLTVSLSPHPHAHPPHLWGPRPPGRGEGRGLGGSIEPCCWHIVKGADWMLTACLMATQLQPPPRALEARGQGRGKVCQARPGCPDWAGGGPGMKGWWWWL